MRTIIYLATLLNFTVLYSQGSKIIFEPVGIQYVSLDQNYFYKDKIDSLESANEREFPSDDVILHALSIESFEIVESIIKEHSTKFSATECKEFGSLKISILDQSGQAIQSIYLCGADVTITFLREFKEELVQYSWVDILIEMVEYYIGMINDYSYLDKD